MEVNLELYIRQRCRKLGISISSLCREAGISRQTLYQSWQIGEKYPSLNTLVNIAHVLKIHPLRLLQLMFIKEVLPETVQSTPGDSSAFVSDVTFPDGEQVFTGQRFQKVWCIQNVGDIAWKNRALICQDDELVIFSNTQGELNLAQRLIPDNPWIDLPVVTPGETVEIKATFTAPDSPGSVVSYWKMVNEDGSYCFANSKGLWVKVSVVAPTRAAGVPEQDWQEMVRQTPKDWHKQ
ncbi:NBR1-Ig-like domain-containing protein [Marinospirillum sp.]|uniref:NBR1-Ig-like domain-containing protein n=1 Tax=Marinospirillum sp. TaxID=2183934 RepID=UPI0038511828